MDTIIQIGFHEAMTAIREGKEAVASNRPQNALTIISTFVSECLQSSQYSYIDRKVLGSILASASSESRESSSTSNTLNSFRHKFKEDDSDPHGYIKATLMALESLN